VEAHFVHQELFGEEERGDDCLSDVLGTQVVGSPVFPEAETFSKMSNRSFLLIYTITAS
jgi:hypothetical protein